MHCFYSENYLVTVHRDDCPSFTEMRERYAKRNKPIERPALLLYKIISGLVDSFFPILADFDDRIDELEDAIFTNAGDAELQEIFAMKRLFVGLRKAIGPQRDMFASVMGGVAELPGMTEDDERYFRDIYDHLIRISELIDTYRDLLTSSMDVYLSTVSNRHEHRDEAADDHRHDLPAAQLADRLLRPELRVPRPAHRRLAAVRLLRDRLRGSSPSSC